MHDNDTGQFIFRDQVAGMWFANTIDAASLRFQDCFQNFFSFVQSIKDDNMLTIDHLRVPSHDHGNL